MKTLNVALAALLVITLSTVHTSASEPGPRPIRPEQMMGVWEGISTQFPYAVSMDIVETGGTIAMCSGAGERCTPEIFEIQKVEVTGAGEISVRARSLEARGGASLVIQGQGNVYGKRSSIQGVLRVRDPGQPWLEMAMVFAQWPDGFLRTAGALLQKVNASRLEHLRSHPLEKEHRDEKAKPKP